MIFEQPFIGMAVVVLCTSVVIYNRRSDLLSLVTVRADTDTLHDTTGMGWQEARERLLSGRCFRKTEEDQLVKIIQDCNDPMAKLALADISFFGTTHYEPDYQRAFKQYEECYSQHHLAPAAHMLALYYAEGLGVKTDPSKALVLYQLAAKANHRPSHLTLAHWYSAGLHVKADCPTVRQHLSAVAVVVNEQVLQRKRKYRSVVPPESIVEKEARKDVLSMFPSKELIEYYRYSADRGQIESQVHTFIILTFNNTLDHTRPGSLPRGSRLGSRL